MIRAGVIGVGVMGRNHARVFHEMGILAAVCDGRSDIARKTAERFGCQAYGDVEDLLKEGELDAVSIATPTSTHYEIAKKCMERGLHVLLEKPIADDPGRAAELIRHAEKYGIVFTVGHIERFNPIITPAKRFLEKGTIGDLISVSARRVSPFPGRIKDAGAIMDIAIHDVDLLRYLMGTGILSVSAVASGNKHPRAEDIAHILLDFNGDRLGHIEVNWMMPFKIRTISVTGSRDFAEIDLLEREIRFRYFDKEAKHRVVLTNGESVEPLRREIEDFVRSVETGKKPRVSPWEAYEALKVCTACITSYREHRVVHLGREEG